MNLAIKAYRLKNKIQHYEWGTKNENAFIPNFLGIKPEKDLPYAELWIGAHPKASSEIEIDGKYYPLIEIIKEFPNECLGEKVAADYHNQLPFLLKVLSAGQALSIQTHPNKLQAKELHAHDPKNYPDENHKPEIAIAIDSLKAIAGFRPVKDIVAILKRNYEIKYLTEEELYNRILDESDVEILKQLIIDLYGRILFIQNDDEKLINCINRIEKRLREKPDLSEEEKQFLTQYELYGNDVGLFSFFFFNIVELKPGEAIFTDSGVPHAYLKGNIIECMANSDNVVRAGLTNKFKDVNTLLKILRYDFEEYRIINRDSSIDTVYTSIAEEFEVTIHTLNENEKSILHSENTPAIILILDGEIEYAWVNESAKNYERLKKGESIFIPAALKEVIITPMENTKYVKVVVPNR